MTKQLNKCLIKKKLIFEFVEYTEISNISNKAYFETCLVFLKSPAKKKPKKQKTLKATVFTK